MATQIQNVIATRTLVRTHPDGTISNVDIYIGDLTYNPSEAPDSADWWTAWVDVMGVDTSDDYCKVAGDDSIQAVYLALARAGMILSGAAVAGQLEDIGVPNFGFPLLPSDPYPGC